MGHHSINSISYYSCPCVCSWSPPLLPHHPASTLPASPVSATCLFSGFACRARTPYTTRISATTAACHQARCSGCVTRLPRARVRTPRAVCAYAHRGTCAERARRCAQNALAFRVSLHAPPRARSACTVVDFYPKRAATPYAIDISAYFLVFCSLLRYFTFYMLLVFLYLVSLLCTWRNLRAPKNKTRTVKRTRGDAARRVLWRAGSQHSTSTQTPRARALFSPLWAHRIAHGRRCNARRDNSSYITTPPSFRSRAFQQRHLIALMPY